MIARKSFLMMITNSLTLLIGWIGLIILVRLWGSFAPTALGIIAFGMSFIGIFSIITNLGYNRAHVKRISEGKELGKCMGIYISIKLVMSVLLAAIVLGGISIWKIVFHKEFYDATKESVIYLFLIYYILYNIVQIPIFTFRAKQEIAKTEIPLLIGNIVRVVGMILVAIAGVTGISIIDKELGYDSIPPKYSWPKLLQPIQSFLANHAIGSLAAVYGFGMLVTLVIMLSYLKKYPISKPTKEYFHNYTIFAIPIMLSYSMVLINQNIDKVAIGYFWTPQEVGYYFGAQRITLLIQIIPLALGTLIFPTISSFHSKNKIVQIKSIVELSMRYISMLVSPIIIFMLIFNKPIINIILTSEFYPATTVLCLLAIYMWIHVLNTPYGYLIGGMDKPAVAAKISITACCINIVLNLLFIPRNGLLSQIGIYGIEGAAIATIIAALFRFVTIRVVAKRLIEIKFVRINFLLHVVAGILMGLLLWNIDQITTLTRFYHLIFYSLFGLMFYLFILYLLDEFTKKEYDLVMNTLNINEMKRYIVTELKRKN